MRGDWDQLVSMPTERETAAALAEVRVRALVHAGRARGRRRVLTGLGAAALLGFGFLVGRRTASVAPLTIGAAVEMARNTSVDYEVVPSTEAPTAAEPATTAEPVQRFHITAWTEWEGQRMNEGEGYVEGPPGTSFEIEQWLEGANFTGRLRATGPADSASVNVFVETRRSRGFTSRGHELLEEGRAFNSISVRRGQAVVFYPFGREPGRPVTSVRIEGPLAPPPADPATWRPGEPPRWSANLRNPLSDLYRAASQTVRIARLTPGSLSLRGFYAPTERISISLADRDVGPVSWVSPMQGALLKVPGLDVHVRVTLTWPPAPGWHACLRVGPAYDGEARAPGKPPILASGCFPKSNPWAPIEVTANSGERLRLQIFP